VPNCSERVDAELERALQQAHRDLANTLQVAAGEPEQLRFSATSKARPVIVPENWRSLTVLSVPVAGKLLDPSRQGAYDAAGRRYIPTLRIGRKLVVPVAKLRRLLGELPAQGEAF
jgi:hypothetical protein